MSARARGRSPKGWTILAAACAVVVVSTACSVEQTLPAPFCEQPSDPPWYYLGRPQASSWLIEAQSVPTASQIPCLLPLPTGWSVATVRINEHHTVVTLDSDRAGEGAAVLRFEEQCDVTRSVSAVSDLPAADRYDVIEQVAPSFEAARYYVFPGGCVSWTFDFDEGTSATESVAIGGVLVLFSRQEINDSIRETFIDEEL